MTPLVRFGPSAGSTGTTSIDPTVSWPRMRLKSAMTIGSTPWALAKDASVSPLRTTTTNPGTFSGGMRRICPALSGKRNPGFDHVISRNGIFRPLAIDSSVSPAATV